MPTTREILEKREAKNLAVYAVKSISSKGRKFPEKPDKYRLCFQKDKERIIHSKAFRRLDEKTQVFIAGSGDHYRTRLTHTLEVAQISRDIARRLDLNEDLCEAIALAHDLGHPPFGHSGEDALDEMMKKYGMRFEHNEQSKRIVEKLEKVYPDFDGLNLTYEVLDGLIKHKTPFDQSSKKFKTASHLEAQVVNMADEIAYNNHDIDDGLRSDIIKIAQLKKLDLWKISEKQVVKKYGKNIPKNVFVPRMISAIMSFMIDDLCVQSEKNIKKEKNPTINFSSKMKKMVEDLRKFLRKNFYFNPRIRKPIIEGEKMIKKLFEHYVKNHSVVWTKDYIAGMTDRFLVKEFKEMDNRK